MVTICHAVFIAFYYIFSFCSHKNPGLGNKRMQWGVEPGFNLKCSDSRAISFNHYTVLLLNCRWNVVFHFLHFHFFNYEFFSPLCLYVLFLFFSPENSLSCFSPFAIGLLIIYINCLKLHVLRKSALCQLCYRHFPPGFHLIFVCGFFFFAIDIFLIFM